MRYFPLPGRYSLTVKKKHKCPYDHALINAVDETLIDASFRYGTKNARLPQGDMPCGRSFFRLYGFSCFLLSGRNSCILPAYLEPKYKAYIGNKLFPKLLVIKTLVKKDMWDQFVNRLRNLLRKYPEVKVSFMGGPANWLTGLRSV